MNDTFFRLTAVAVMVAGFGTSGYYRAIAETKGGRLPERPEGLPSAPLRIAIGILMWGALLLPLVAPGWVRWSFVELPATIRWLGFAISVLVVPLIWWTMRSIGTNVSASISTREGATLVTRGPYRWIRHPIYTSGFMIFIGFTLMLGSLLLGAAVLGLLVFIPYRASREERNLIGSFGDAYRAYIRRTGRFLPRLIRS
jgi:protein-S-isoprenylcysteine O-methyltransferase Ste14